MSKEAIIQKLSDFLDEPVNDGTKEEWATVTMDQHVELIRLFYDIIDHKFPPDLGGSSSIQVNTVVRKTHEIMWFNPLPYYDRDMPYKELIECLNIAQGNVFSASEQLKHLTDICIRKKRSEEE